MSYFEVSLKFEKKQCLCTRFLFIFVKTKTAATTTKPPSYNFQKQILVLTFSAIFMSRLKE